MAKVKASNVNKKVMQDEPIEYHTDQNGMVEAAEAKKLAQRLAKVMREKEALEALVQQSNASIAASTGLSTASICAFGTLAIIGISIMFYATNRD